MTDKIEKSSQNDAAVVAMFERIFDERGLKVEISGCGCCDSPWLEVKFADGTVYATGNFAIRMIDNEGEDN